jgi:hypothetical protein
LLGAGKSGIENVGSLEQLLPDGLSCWMRLNFSVSGSLLSSIAFVAASIFLIAVDICPKSLMEQSENRVVRVFQIFLRLWQILLCQFTQDRISPRRFTRIPCQAAGRISSVVRHTRVAADERSRVNVLVWIERAVDAGEELPRYEWRTLFEADVRENLPGFLVVRSANDFLAGKKAAPIRCEGREAADTRVEHSNQAGLRRHWFPLQTL